MNKTTEALKLSEEALLGSGYYDTTQQRKALAAIREARAEQEKQEPVAWAYFDADGAFMDALDRQHGAYQTPLHAEPVSAEAIRAEALEEAAKLCEQGTGDAVQTDVLKALWKERERIAEVIRGLK